MREAMLICPCGNEEARDYAIDWATRAFGGVTVDAARGWWRDGEGQTLNENVQRLHIACDGDAHSAFTLRAMARQFGYEAQQDCVYLRLPSGDVELIETRHLWDRAHPRWAEHSHPRLVASSS